MRTYLYIFFLFLFCVPMGIYAWLLSGSIILAASIYLICGVIFVGLLYRDEA